MRPNGGELFRDSPAFFVNIHKGGQLHIVESFKQVLFADLKVGKAIVAHFHLFHFLGPEAIHAQPSKVVQAIDEAIHAIRGPLRLNHKACAIVIEPEFDVWLFDVVFHNEYRLR